jgi:membrane associated rhomboid family serine protease
MERNLMFPIGDDNSSIKIFPVVTYALIALNVLFFFVELGGGTAFIERWAFVPARFVADPVGDSITLLPKMYANICNHLSPAI